MMKPVKPQISVEEALKDPEAWIPRGILCYACNFDADDPDEMTSYLCPFWDLREDMPEFANGYCHYLKRGDWEAGYYSLVWDECKECRVNYDVGFAVEEDGKLKAMRGRSRPGAADSPRTSPDGPAPEGAARGGCGFPEPEPNRRASGRIGAMGGERDRFDYDAFQALDAEVAAMFEGGFR